jgi:hypothetical protein
MTFLRPLLRPKNPIAALRRQLATQSGTDAVKPVAVARLHLEDGTTLVGKSFGSHESVEGEVCYMYYDYVDYYVDYYCCKS